MLSLLQKTKELALDILFPAACANCKTSLERAERERFLCETCLRTLPLHSTLFCAECKARLPENKKICHKDTPYLLGAATSYNHPLIKALVWEMKYQRHPWAAEPLGALLARYVQSLAYDLTSYALFPLPLHPARERERGFNQAELILESANRILKLPTMQNPTSRVKHGKPQAEIHDYYLRKENVAGSFAVNYPGLVAGKNIIIVDDVSTSGSTLHEIARVLKDAGAKKIVGLVVAKAG